MDNLRHLTHHRTYKLQESSNSSIAAAALNAAKALGTNYRPSANGSEPFSLTVNLFRAVGYAKTCATQQYHSNTTTSTDLMASS